MEKPCFNKVMKCKCDVTKPKLTITTMMKASVTTTKLLMFVQKHNKNLQMQA